MHALLEEYEVRPSSNPDVLLSSLSGGNQQKALVAKWMSLPHLRVLLLHEPTQGVDIGSKQAIFRCIAAAAERGIAVLYVSAEYKDLAALCDRVLIMRGGQIRAELKGQELTEDRIVEQCYRSGAIIAA